VRPGLHRGSWSPRGDEEELLKVADKGLGFRNWAKIAEALGKATRPGGKSAGVRSAWDCFYEYRRARLARLTTEQLSHQRWGRPASSDGGRTLRPWAWMTGTTHDPAFSGQSTGAAAGAGSAEAVRLPDKWVAERRTGQSVIVVSSSSSIMAGLSQHILAGLVSPLPGAGTRV